MMFLQPKLPLKIKWRRHFHNKGVRRADAGLFNAWSVESLSLFQKLTEQENLFPSFFASCIHWKTLCVPSVSFGLDRFLFQVCQRWLWTFLRFLLKKVVQCGRYGAKKCGTLHDFACRPCHAHCAPPVTYLFISGQSRVRVCWKNLTFLSYQLGKGQYTFYPVNWSRFAEKK